MKRFLWIEDDAYRLQGLVRPLEKEGFKIDIATDYPSFMNRLEADKYDLFIVDLILPQAGIGEVIEEKNLIRFVGMDIIDLLYRKYPDIPIVVVTVVIDSDTHKIAGHYKNVKEILVKGDLLPSDFREVVSRILGLQESK